MLKIGMFYYSDPELAPQVVLPAKALAQAGYQVDLVAYYRCGNNERPDAASGIRLIYLNRPGMDFPVGPLGKVREITDFIRRSISIARQERYDIVYGHDTHGFLAAHQAGRALRVPVVYHCHDLSQRQRCGFLDRWVKRYEMRHSQEADLVILPESRRAAFLKEENGLKREPLVVWNCPLKDFESQGASNGRFPGLAATLGDDAAQVVIRHGPLWSEGRGHCIEETIRSMPLWPSNAHFVLLGHVAAAYASAVRRLTASLGVGKRLHLLPRVRHNEVAGFLHGAAVGHALYHLPQDLNKRYQSTASLKFFEYMRSGLPILAPDEPGFRGLIEEFECGLFVDPTDAGAIGRAICDLLEDGAMRQRLGQNALSAYHKRCHYEAQYEPVLSVFKQLLS